MARGVAGWVRWVFDPADGARHHLVARWVFLRCLGLIYFSAFYSLLFQVKGLIGPAGILPAGEYLQDVAQGIGAHALRRWWFAPTVLWWSSSSHMLMVLCWIGLIAAVLAVLNVWPRGMLGICFVCFLSFVAAAGEFSGYQSDGMLLEAGFLSMFLAPGGLWPRLGVRSLPSRASLFLLVWEWFRIYFLSGVVKLMSGDRSWRDFTAMDEYYQNGPLPSWVGWYAQHLPHGFHAGTVVATLVMELLLVWLVFLPGRWRLACFWIVTVWQAGVILTANYAFLNYLVLVLGFLLLDDRFAAKVLPDRWRRRLLPERGAGVGEADPSAALRDDNKGTEWGDDGRRPGDGYEEGRRDDNNRTEWDKARGVWGEVRFGFTAVAMTWIFYAATLPMVRMFWRGVPLPMAPVAWLEPFRIANQYGLFAVMTPHRYEIEFQGSNDGRTWVAYPFRYKAQDVRKPPGMYAPYQPRFDWNLWFASLGTWAEYPMVPRTEERLLVNDRDVLGLFAGNPFAAAPPKYVRAVLWQYWFSSMEEKRKQGIWWRRELLGTYAPTLVRVPDGRFGIVERPTLSGGMPD